MKMKSFLLAGTAVGLLSLSSPAQAGDMYVSVFGGLNWLQDSSHANHTTFGSSTSGGTYLWETDADTGFVLGGTIGTHLTNWHKGLSVELEASYRRNDVGGHWFTGTFTDGGGPPATSTSNGPIDANMSTFALMANVWYEHDMGWNIRPYIGGGVGWARAKFDGALVSWTTTLGDVSNDGFAWQLGAGFNYAAAPGVNVGLNYRYFEGPNIGDPLDGAESDADFGGALDNNNHNVTVSLTIDID